ncbi:MAG: hypothetical protein WAV55_11500 [Clostridiaceae bacterium]
MVFKNNPALDFDRTGFEPFETLTGGCFADLGDDDLLTSAGFEIDSSEVFGISPADPAFIAFALVIIACSRDLTCSDRGSMDSPSGFTSELFDRVILSGKGLPQLLQKSVSFPRTFLQVKQSSSSRLLTSDFSSKFSPQYRQNLTFLDIVFPQFGHRILIPPRLRNILIAPKYRLEIRPS